MHKLFGFILLAITSSLAMAEYKAIVEKCDIFPFHEACKSIPDSNKRQHNSFGLLNEDEANACKAIADNINEMEQNGYNSWNRGFAISANNYLLSKPQWTETTEKERCDALAVKFNDKNYDLMACKSATINPLYVLPYNLDSSEGDEKIYIGNCTSKKGSCGSHRTTLWTTTANITQRKLGNEDVTTERFETDPVMFNSRLYFVEYNRGVVSYHLKPGSFVVHEFRAEPGGIKRYLPKCLIEPIDKPVSSQE